MTVLVTNCFHWIGFHIVNHLLENGYQVDGEATCMTTSAEHFALMVGRNDAFSLIRDKSDRKENYQLMIINQSDEAMQHIKTKKSFKLCRNHEDKTNLDRTAIILPMLFGEWMPMDEQGIYDQGNFISFNSEVFTNEAVYIGDFIQCLMQCLHSSHLPSQFKIKSERQRTLATEHAAQIIFLRDSRPVEKQVKAVSDHYNRFKAMYPSSP
ncbi:hypothetical protein WMZ97_19905 [Lentibacillus sp. N15]|uniref:hypothetical protein n=1 Tax=Lentibacillus songyuanensis TaxID=3136161 RepID=UPI0031BA3F4A